VKKVREWQGYTLPIIEPSFMGFSMNCLAAEGNPRILCYLGSLVSWVYQWYGGFVLDSLCTYMIEMMKYDLRLFIL